MSSSACTSTTVSVSDSSELTSTCTSARRRLRDRRVGAAPLVDLRREVDLARERALDRLRDAARRRRRRPDRTDRHPGTRRARNRRWCRTGSRPEHVEAAHRERAGQHHQEPGPVAGDDGDRRRGRRRSSSQRTVGESRSSSSCMHIVSTSKASTYCSGRRARNVAGPFAPEPLVQGLAPVGGDCLRLAPLDRGRRLHEQVADERGLRRAPRGRAGRLRVADRQQVEQPEPFGIARARGGDVVGHRRVGEIAARRDLGHEQVVAHEPRQDLAGFAVETHAPHDLLRRLLRRPRSGRRACPWRCRAATRPNNNSSGRRHARATTASTSGSRPGASCTSPASSSRAHCATASSRCRSTV